MQKVFIFDMDGVIMNSEETWVKEESAFAERLFGKEVHERLGDVIGITLSSYYRLAVQAGFKKSEEVFRNAYNTAAKGVYDKTVIAPDIDVLVNYLLENNYKIAILSSSPRQWINWVVERLSFKDRIDLILSLDERKDIHPKPHPDGYREVMRLLRSDPKHTIVLEDSNAGITGAMKAHAYTIAYAGSLIDGYHQIPADAKASSMKEVLEIVKQRQGLF